MKSGEIIAKQGIVHHDVFSYNTKDREWYPYEWLFQVAMYGVKTAFGLWIIPYITALVITAWMVSLYLVLQYIVRTNVWISLGLTFFYYVSTYEFFSARPHIFAYLFLTLTLLLILLYLYRNKNLLWMTIPITLAWTNLHGSIFLAIYFFAAFTVIALISHQKTKAKTLGLFTLLTAVLTILPPLWLTQYRLLWIFFRERAFISTFIDEWTPLSTNTNGFIFFTVAALFAFTGIGIAFWRTKDKTRILLILPLLPFFLMAYMASRNIVLGYLAAVIFLGWVIAAFPQNLRRWKIPVLGAAVLVLVLYVWMLWQKRTPQRFYYPEGAVQFILSQKLAGHMFNEYGYGGYLLYNLYPAQQVFYDGRTDLYLCCEMPDTLKLAKQKLEPDEKYKELLDWLWNKYDISFVLMRTEKHTVLRKIARVLTNDADWSLVYWDDHSQIFVRHNGKNDTLLERLGATAATPYERNPYLPGQEKTAMVEYSQMMGISDSARTRNAIGYLLMKQQKQDEAKIEFEKAMSLDPLFESPYMNIAELAVKAGDVNTAIYLYQEAMKLAPDRGLIYIRLGQLYKDEAHDLNTAKRVWQVGLQKTVDEDAKKTLTGLLR